MRRIVMWFASTVSVVVLLFGYHTSTSGPTNTTSQLAIVSGAASSGSTTSSTTSSSGSGSGSSGSGSTRPTTKKKATKQKTTKKATTKTVTGAAASTPYGPVQVQLTVTGGAITKVAVVQYPTGSSQDDEINSRALPILIQETLSSQNANIDMVSGATFTSDGYLQFLQSGLDQAGL